MLLSCGVGEDSLRVPWTARKSNQSILKEISPEYSLEGLIMKLKLQYFGHLKQRTDWLEKTLMLGKIEGGRRGWQRMIWWNASPTQWTWVWASLGSRWWTGRPIVLQFMGSQIVRHDWVSELNWGHRSNLNAHQQMNGYRICDTYIRWNISQLQKKNELESMHYSPWGCKESDTTERLNWIELKYTLLNYRLIKLRW